MERVDITPRPDWQAKSEQLGFTWHTPEGYPYWNEGAYWKLSQVDVDAINYAVSDGYAMLVDAINFVINNRQLGLFGFSDEVQEMIETSWANRGGNLALYGRFNIAYDGVQAKIMDFNGDNPSNLFETSMAQRAWLEEVFPQGRQVNSIHEALIARFRQVQMLQATQLRTNDIPHQLIHITCLTPNPEAETTAVYLQNCANEAGILSKFVALSDIGWQDSEYDDENGYFLDLEGQEISSLLKLAPLNWLLQDDFGGKLVDLVNDDDLEIMEPAWKLLASHKRILSVMWDRNAFHPALLQTSSNVVDLAGKSYVRKPVNGIDGQNITLYSVAGAVVDETGGAFADDDVIYQEAVVCPGRSIGAWVIDSGVTVGLSFREADTPITDSGASFVPHIVA